MPFPNEPAAEGWRGRGYFSRGGISAVQPRCITPQSGCRAAEKAVYFNIFKQPLQYRAHRESAHLRLVNVLLSEEVYAVVHIKEGRRNLRQEIRELCQNNRSIISTRNLILA